MRRGLNKTRRHHMRIRVIKRRSKSRVRKEGKYVSKRRPKTRDNNKKI